MDGNELAEGRVIEMPPDLVPELKASLRSLVHELVQEHYAALEADGRSGDMTAEIIQQILADYSVHLIDLPNGAWRYLNVLRYQGDDMAWGVDLVLWTQEEGRSDLTLLLDARIVDGSLTLRMEDIHVM